MRNLCIIPARCGSKGIPYKNIIDLCGKPLIDYTIEIVLKLKQNGFITDAIVSTDCEKIADHARSTGIDVPFLRPENISDDKAKSIDFVLHSIDFFRAQNIEFDNVIVLQPTSPLKEYDDVLNALKLFSTNQSESLISAYEEETINDLIMYHCKGDKAIALNKDHNSGIRRQEHGSVYIRNGAIYITKVNYIEANHKIVSNEPLLYKMGKNKSINIDSFEDLEYVRNLLCK